MMSRDSVSGSGPWQIRYSEALSPSFGRASLDNCEREQIHLADSIQPHGALLVLRQTDLAVQQASENLCDFLNIPPRDCLGLALAEIAPALAVAVRALAGQSLDLIPMALRVEQPNAGALDVVVHRAASGELIAEIERAGPPVVLAGAVEAGLGRIIACADMAVLCDDAAKVFRALSGYDRVMIYRFDAEGNGAVVAEARRDDLEPLLGNHYPASDIPHIARRLYLRNRVRVLADVAFVPVPIIPPRAPEGGGELDLSLATLRSPSPIHVQYLKNMGVRATLVVSLVVDGQLWGLISCHHDTPRVADFGARAVYQLLAEAMASRIAALESFVQSQLERAVRRIEARIISTIGQGGDWRCAVVDGARSLLDPLGATGVALLCDGESLTEGVVPNAAALREIAVWLDEQALHGVARNQIFATCALSIDAPRFLPILDVASGLVVAPISATQGEYVLWFRPELIRTITWGGDPRKPVEVGPDLQTISPRHSFAHWYQLVSGTAMAWSAAELAAGRMIGETITDLVLQFRAARILVAEQSVQQAMREVAQSDQPMLIADAFGELLIVNHAFQAVMPQGAAPPGHIDDLPALFHAPEDMRRRLADLRHACRAWRGDVMMRTQPDMQALPLLVRADPVIAQPGVTVGYVILFTNLSARRDAERARHAFQDSIAEGQRVIAARLGRQDGNTARKLLTALLENAQLAAMEITDGVDALGMVRRLDSVRASVQRTAELIERLIRHAGSAT